MQAFYENKQEKKPRQRFTVAPEMIIESRGDNGHNQPQSKIDELPLDEKIGVLVYADAVRLARARQNDKAQRHENRDY